MFVFFDFGFDKELESNSLCSLGRWEIQRVDQGNKQENEPTSLASDAIRVIFVLDVETG